MVGKQVSNDGGGASVSQVEGMVKPVDMETATARGAGTVMEEESNNDAALDLGVINGTIMENLSVNGWRENITDMERFGGAEKKEPKRKEELIPKEREVKSKGKVCTINGHSNGVGDVEEQEKKGKESKEMGVEAARGGKLNVIPSVSSGEQSRVV